jgi:6-phosphofructokinase 1
VKVRSVEINIPQRTAGHLTSYTDIDEAFDEGKYATEVALNGETGVMITINRISDFPYATTLGTTDVNDVAGLVKHVPREWINERGNDVTDEFITYAKPLIQGEVDLNFKDGLPDYYDIKHLTNIK